MIDLSRDYNAIHGDCIEAMKDIPDGSVDLVLTDPPFGTTYSEWDMTPDFEALWEQVLRVTKESAAILMFSAEPFTSELILSNKKLFRYDLIWKKNHITDFMNAKVKPLRNHENICVFYKRKPTYNPEMWEGTYYYHKAGNSSSTVYRLKEKRSYEGNMRYPRTVMEFTTAKNREGNLHPNQKPEEMLRYLIRMYSNKGDLVLDPYMGSGSCGRSALLEDRRFIGCELDDTFFEIASKRIKEISCQRRLF